MFAQVGNPPIVCRVLKTPVLQEVRRLFLESQESLTIVAPFISNYGLNVLAEALDKSGARPDLSVLTAVTVSSVQGGSLDAQSLAAFCEQFPRCRVRNLPGLHAKVYVEDSARVIVTSANLTRGGLVANYEYGVLMEDAAIATRTKHDMLAYANLGADLSAADLVQVAQHAQEVQSAVREAERDVRSSDAWRRLRGTVNALRDDLLRQRVRGVSVNSFFARTILYLLRNGPMTTVEIHARVKDIHPDMCDDTIDRVIGGVHFGKKWKHMVRNSQQYLKNREQIRYAEGKWRLVGKPGNSRETP